ncbi:hypothetical protein BGM09_12785 [Streptomyces sp. CBMA29]|nr:hypothetical protein [Streptomyces sp. CBMA29]
MAERGGRHGDGAGLERKIRSGGRPWTVGDIVMVDDGQWAVDLPAPADPEAEVAEGRAADGRRVEMTLEELARAIGARFGGTHRDDTTDSASALLHGSGGAGRRVLVGDVRGEPEHGAYGGVSERSGGDDLADEPEGGVRTPSERAVGVGLVPLAHQDEVAADPAQRGEVRSGARGGAGGLDDGIEEPKQRRVGGGPRCGAFGGHGQVLQGASCFGRCGSTSRCGGQADRWGVIVG